MREMFSRREMEELLRKIDQESVEVEGAGSRFPHEDKDTQRGIRIGLQRAGKLLEDLLRKTL